MMIDATSTYLSSNIRHLRQKHRLSRRALASLAGISIRSLDGIEQPNPYCEVSDVSALRFCSIFGLPVEVLFHSDLSEES